MTPAPSSTSSSSAVRGRVLIVDDDAAVARSVARMLRRAHDTVVAASAEEARRLASADGAFDAILCDLFMPGLSGRDLHAWMAAERPALLDRVAFMTGGTSDERMQSFVESAGRPCLEKPMDPARLRDVVATLVAGSRAAAHADPAPPRSQPEG